MKGEHLWLGGLGKEWTTRDGKVSLGYEKLVCFFYSSYLGDSVKKGLVSNLIILKDAVGNV